jgi:hypothetical protein
MEPGPMLMTWAIGTVTYAPGCMQVASSQFLHAWRRGSAGIIRLHCGSACPCLQGWCQRRAQPTTSQNPTNTAAKLSKAIDADAASSAHGWPMRETSPYRNAAMRDESHSLACPQGSRSRPPLRPTTNATGIRNTGVSETAHTGCICGQARPALVRLRSR